MVEFHAMILRKKMRYSIFALAMATISLSCSVERPYKELHVAAATSLTRVFQELAAAFEVETGISVIASFASTGQLAQQIRNGAPFDIFAAADARHIDDLIDSGHLTIESRTEYALGALVLVQPRQPAPALHSLSDLTQASVKRIAIANPEHAPYGIAAQQTLASLGYLEELQPKIIYGETVRQAAVMVGTGNAEAGLIARSVLDESLTPVMDIGADLHQPILHVAAMLTEADDNASAKAFLAFLVSPQSRDIFQAYGLMTP